VVTDHLNFGDVDQWWYLSHASILRERSDLFERLASAGPFPVG
jgi:hypothetical protein